MKRLITSPVIWLIFITLLSLISYMKPGMPFVDDGQDHVVRIATFYTSLTEGILVPRWGGNLNWGYGHPVIMFLYPFSAYIGSFFHAIGFSFVDSTKVVFILSSIAATLTMYLWLRSAFGKKVGFIGALLYSFAPYRFVDLYVRGAIGEHMAFVFPPLILYFLFNIASATKDKTHKNIWKYIIGCSLSMASLILSHNAVALMFLPVIFLYALYLFFTETKNKLLFSVFCSLSFVLGFSLSSFFWVPALLEGKFTLRDIVTKGEALTRFVPIQMFFYSPWKFAGGNDTTKFVGIAQWIGVLASVIFVIKTKLIRTRVLLISLLVFFVGSLFIMTKSSSFIWKQFMILQNFQFPWRFQTLTVFITAALGGIAVGGLLKNIGQKTMSIRQKELIIYRFITPQILLVFFCLLIVVSTAHMWKPKGYKIEHESLYTGIYKGTTDTGESSPIWSIRFMEHTPPNPLSVVDGDANVTVISRTSTVHEYDISVKKPTLMMENTVFFPGWKIYVDGIATGIQFQNPDYRGLMLFRVTEGDHRVRVVFEDTVIRKTANMISLISLGILISVMIGGILWTRKR